MKWESMNVTIPQGDDLPLHIMEYGWEPYSVVMMSGSTRYFLKRPREEDKPTKPVDDKPGPVKRTRGELLAFEIYQKSIDWLGSGISARVQSCIADTIDAEIAREREGCLSAIEIEGLDAYTVMRVAQAIRDRSENGDK